MTFSSYLIRMHDRGSGPVPAEGLGKRPPSPRNRSFKQKCAIRRTGPQYAGLRWTVEFVRSRGRIERVPYGSMPNRQGAQLAPPTLQRLT